MRKLLTSIVIFMLFSMFSVPAIAGKYQVCEEFKGYKRLFGLCNAYQNALAHEDEEAMADISDNWDNWVNELGEPALPNRVPDTGDDDVGEEVPVICPCWDFQKIVDAIQCEGYEYYGYIPDTSGDDSGVDSLSLLWPGPFYDDLIQMYAGNLFVDVTECRINAAHEYTVSQQERLDRQTEIQCRLDVVDLAEVALSPGGCGTYPQTE